MVVIRDGGGDDDNYDECCGLAVTCVAMMTMRASGAAHAMSRAM
jgi:hypothetical protein